MSPDRPDDHRTTEPTAEPETIGPTATEPTTTEPTATEPAATESPISEPTEPGVPATMTTDHPTTDDPFRRDRITPDSLGDDLLAEARSIDDPFTASPPDDPTTRQDPMVRDPASLLGGIVLLVLALLFSVLDFETFAQQGRLLWPLALLGLGCTLLFGGRSGPARARRGGS